MHGFRGVNIIGGEAGREAGESFVNCVLIGARD